jgi:HEXXH motif-containing protein
VITTHWLTGDAFAAIAGGDGDPAVVRHLRAVQHSKHLVLLRAVARAADGTDAASPAVAAFRAAYQVLSTVQTADPDLVAGLFSLPHFGGWAHDCLVRTGQGLAPDFGYLASVAAAAAVRAGVGFELDVPVHSGRLLFPGLGYLHVTGEDRWIRLRSDGKRVSGDALADTWCASLVPDDGSGAQIAGWQGTPMVRTVAGGHTWNVLLETTDLNLDRFTLPMSAALTASDVADWRRCIQSAWELLVRHHGWVSAALAEGISVIVPLTGRGDAEQDSETTPAAFGAVATTWPPDPVIMAETLVHEFQHLKLCGLLDIVTLVEPNDEQVYAPWRPDPRPAVGLLHGLYAHLGIARFWSVQRKAETEPDNMLRAQVMYERWRHAIEPAASTLRSSGCLTPPGDQFAGMLLDRARRLDDEPVPGHARDIAGEVALEHWLTWQLRHTRVEATRASDLAAAYQRGEAFRDQPLPALSIGAQTRVVDSVLRSRLLNMRYQNPRRYRELCAAGAAGLSEADVLLVNGKTTQAAQAYRDRIAGTAGEHPDAWIGLALASQRLAAASLREAFATHLPLMVDLHARLRAQGVRRDPLDLAAWFT